MPLRAPSHHILVCNSFRLTGEPQGVCNRKDARTLLQQLEEGAADRGLDVQISSTGCLKMCERGPVLAVQPNNAWYGQVDGEAIERILDGIEEGCLPTAGRIA